jgi:hypothetical protein
MSFVNAKPYRSLIGEIGEIGAAARRRGGAEPAVLRHQPCGHEPCSARKLG